MADQPAPDHVLTPTDGTHRQWDNALTPALTVSDGDVVRISCRQASGDAIDPTTTDAEAAAAPFPGHLLTGPIAVEGVRPGDVLAVEILAVDTDEWGHTIVHPSGSERGLLADRFPEPAIYHWNLGTEQAELRHRDDVAIPLAPFPGTVGLAPEADGQHSTIPPRSVGGNLDVKYLTAGSTLFLPVAVDGGLFSIGDGHAAQGDGEVCVTALEAPITATVRISRRPELDIAAPEYTTGTRRWGGQRYGTTGIGEDFRAAARDAVAAMIDRLVTHGLTDEEAYVLCSVAVDLSVNELVNERIVVSAHLPEGVFP